MKRHYFLKAMALTVVFSTMIFTTFSKTSKSFKRKDVGKVKITKAKIKLLDPNFNFKNPITEAPKVQSTPSISFQQMIIKESQLPFKWNDLVFETSGTQTAFGLKNNKGQDSTATLVLMVDYNK